jgi:hypothetical protein
MIHSRISHSQSQSYFTTGGLPPIRFGAQSLETHGQNFFLNLTPAVIVIIYHPYIISSLTRGRVYRLKLLLALASAVIFGSESRGTCDHILLSQTSLFVASYYSQGSGGGIRPCLHTGITREERDSYLRLAVYRQSVRLGAEPLETHGQNFFSSIEHLRSESLHNITSAVIYNCCWPSPAHSFSGPSLAGLATIFYWFRFETSLFVASYDSQGYGGGIWIRLHTGSLVWVRVLCYDRRSVGQTILE